MISASVVMPFQKGPCGEGGRTRGFLLPLLEEASVVFLVLFLLIFFCPPLSSRNTKVNKRKIAKYRYCSQQKTSRPAAEAPPKRPCSHAPSRSPFTIAVCLTTIIFSSHSPLLLQHSLDGFRSTPSFRACTGTSKINIYTFHTGILFFIGWTHTITTSSTITTFRCLPWGMPQKTCWWKDQASYFPSWFNTNVKFITKKKKTNLDIVTSRRRNSILCKLFDTRGRTRTPLCCPRM